MSNSSEHTFEELLLSTKEREKSGNETSKRFDYQLNWSIQKILSLYEAQVNFSLLYEFHDDIAVIEFDNNQSIYIPLSIEFYQVKTSTSTHWLINDLLKTEGTSSTSGLSIIGKMFDCFNKFQSNTKRLCLVSNKEFNLEIPSSTKSKKYSRSMYDFSIDDLHEEISKKIYEHVQIQFQFKDEKYKQVGLDFEVNEMGIRGQDNYMTGLSDRFLESNCDNPSIKPREFNSILKRMIKSSSNFSTINNTNELIEKRGVNYKKINDLVDKIKKSSQSHKEEKERQKTTRNKIEKSSYDYSLKLDILNAYDEIVVRTSNSEDLAIQSEISEIDLLYDKHIRNPLAKTVEDICKCIIHEITIDKEIDRSEQSHIIALVFHLASHKRRAI